MSIGMFVVIAEMMSCNWTWSTDNVTANGSDLDDNDDLTELRHHLEIIRFVVLHLLAPTIIFAGILANVLTVIVLTRRSMAWSSTNVYLSALAVYDAVYLALAFSMTWKHYDAVRALPWYVRYRLPVGRPLIDSASNTAVWLTVTFTVERFIGVRFPMKGKVTSTDAVISYENMSYVDQFGLNFIILSPSFLYKKIATILMICTDTGRHFPKRKLRFPAHQIRWISDRFD